MKTERSVTAAVRQVIREARRAYNQTNTDGVMAHIGPDAADTATDAHPAVHGTQKGEKFESRAAIRAQVEKEVKGPDQPKFRIDSDNEKDDSVTTQGSVAVAVTHLIYQATNKPDKNVKSTAILEKGPSENDPWRIVEAHIAETP